VKPPSFCPGTRTIAGFTYIASSRLATSTVPFEEAEFREEPDSRALWCLELAKLHTALAQVAATALNSDGREWAEVASRRFSSMEST
jgi:hypothetical protein